MDGRTFEEHATDAADYARKKAREFTDGIKDTADSMKSQSLEDLWDSTVTYARDNPGKTILASLAAGVILGAFLARRGD